MVRYAFPDSLKHKAPHISPHCPLLEVPSLSGTDSRSQEKKIKLEYI